MKRIFAAIFVTLLFAACSSKVINDIKIATATKVKDKSHEVLSKAFKTVTVEGVDCEVQAVQHSEYLYSKTASLLKVHENAKSLTPVAQLACTAAVQGLNMLIQSPDSSTACLRAYGGDKVLYLGSTICNSIEL